MGEGMVKTVHEHFVNDRVFGDTEVFRDVQAARLRPITRNNALDSQLGIGKLDELECALRQLGSLPRLKRQLGFQEQAGFGVMLGISVGRCLEACLRKKLRPDALHFSERHKRLNFRPKEARKKACLSRNGVNEGLLWVLPCSRAVRPAKTQALLVRSEEH